NGKRRESNPPASKAVEGKGMQMVSNTHARKAPLSEPESLSSDGRHHRRLRNYLLEPKVQLKYANLAAAVAIALSVGLGTLLWRTNSELLAQSSAAVLIGEEMLEESRKVTEVVAMSIARDPVYGSNPALKAAFEGDANEQTALHQAKQARLRAQAQALEHQRTQFSRVLIAALALLVLGLWAGAIIVTHRVAGPVFKMRRQLRAVAGGDWSRPSPLRKRDELRSFFEAFASMIDVLRSERRQHLSQLDAAIAALEPDAPAREKLVELRVTMAAALSPDSQAPQKAAAE